METKILSICWETGHVVNFKWEGNRARALAYVNNVMPFKRKARKLKSYIEPLYCLYLIT